MKSGKEILQKARQDWFSEELKAMNMEFPVAEISKKMGKGTGLVSMYLTNKRAMSASFMKDFCTAYGYDFEAINHTLIEKIKNNLESGNYESPPNNDVTESDLKNIDSKANGGLNNRLSSQSTKKQEGEDMMNRILDIIADANANMKIIAESNASLARTVEKLANGKEGERKAAKQQAA